MLKINRILLPIDFPNPSLSVIHQAAALARHGDLDSFLVAKPKASNEFRTQSKRTLSGIAVQMFKTDNALQLINPFAPAKYGSADQNITRNPVTGRASGLKILSIGFGRTDRHH